MRYRALLILFAVLLAASASLAPAPDWLFNIGLQYACAAPGDNISITCTPDNVTGSWAYLNGSGSPVQYLRSDQWYSTETGITWGALKFTLQNDGLQAVDVTIHSDNWIGIGKTWYLSDTATPGIATIGLKAGVVYSTPGYFLVGPGTSYYQALGFSGSENETQYTGYDFSGTADYTVVIKRQEPWNYLVEGLCSTCSVWWGFKILLPTSATGNVEMTGNITLTAMEHT
jgi:hypothetical protein